LKKEVVVVVVVVKVAAMVIAVALITDTGIGNIRVTRATGPRRNPQVDSSAQSADTSESNHKQAIYTSSKQLTILEGIGIKPTRVGFMALTSLSSAVCSSYSTHDQSPFSPKPKVEIGSKNALKQLQVRVWALLQGLSTLQWFKV
jgi:hypothetical protein